MVGWVIGSLFALIVGLAMAQIASAYPTAGGLYHWASILGGRGYGWVCAWINMLGLIFVVASVNVGVYLLFRDLVLAGILGMDVSAWGYQEQVIAVSLITFTQALFNHYGIKTTTAITDFSGYLILVVAVLLTLTFLAWGATWDLSRLTQFINNTGDAGGGVLCRAAHRARGLPGRPALPGLHHHRLRRLGPHLRGDASTPAGRCRAASCTRSSGRSPSA